MESCFFDLIKCQKLYCICCQDFGTYCFGKTSINGAVSFELGFGSFLGFPVLLLSNACAMLCNLLYNH